MCEIIEKYAQEREAETKAVTTLQNAVSVYKHINQQPCKLQCHPICAVPKTVVTPPPSA